MYYFSAQTLTAKMYVNNFILTWKTVKTAVQKESKLLRGTDVSSKLNLKRKKRVHYNTAFKLLILSKKYILHGSKSTPLPRDVIWRSDGDYDQISKEKSSLTFHQMSAFQVTKI